MLAMAANRASRAEVLFGAGVSVGVFDVGSARNLP
jgi:NAD-dependent SIR2 family protein deacetylase